MVVWVGVFNISFASAAEEDFYGWQSFSLAGDMSKVSPGLDNVRWNVMSQTRSEEPFFLLNNSSWGQAGTSENRVSAMLDFKLDQHTHLGLGYLNQYIFRTHKDNRVNHTLLVNMAFNFWFK